MLSLIFLDYDDWLVAWRLRPLLLGWASSDDAILVVGSKWTLLFDLGLCALFKKILVVVEIAGLETFVRLVGWVWFCDEVGEEDCEGSAEWDISSTESLIFWTILLNVDFIVFPWSGYY